MNLYDVEYTDTFGGEANYSWVRRATIALPDGATRRKIMRKAKAKAGLAGVRGITSDFGDMIEFRPFRCCTVMFITFKD